MNFKTAEEKFIVNTFNVAFSSYLVLQYLALKGRGQNYFSVFSAYNASERHL